MIHLKQDAPAEYSQVKWQDILDEIARAACPLYYPGFHRLEFNSDTGSYSGGIPLMTARRDTVLRKIQGYSQVDIAPSTTGWTHIDVRNRTKNISLLPGSRPLSTSDGIEAGVVKTLAELDGDGDLSGDDPVLEYGDLVVVTWEHFQNGTSLATLDPEQEEPPLEVGDLLVDYWIALTWEVANG